MQSYSDLVQHWKKIEVLRATQSLLQWDMETYMPEGSIGTRQEQFVLVNGLEHDWLNDSKFREGVLSGKISGTEDREKRNLELWKKNILVSSAVDSKWVDSYSRAVSQCNMKWRAARADSDFKSVKDSFKKVVELAQEQFLKIKELPELKSRYKEKAIYGVAFDQFEPGFPIENMEKLLLKLCSGIKLRLPNFLASKKPNGNSISTTKLDKDFCKKLMADFGFDFTKGRLDLSTHPFCGGSVGDVRITTRAKPVDAIEDLFSTLHELGHALYEQGLPEETQFEPIGKPASYGVHESQSRFLENFIGRSRPFCKYLGDVVGLSSEHIFAKLNNVKMDFIRVDSDEVTYNFHILLRMQIERDLIEGRLSVDHLPEAWNEKLKDLTGLEITKDSNGCLQDTHWYSGSFGYFPSYSLGNMFAAELFKDFEQLNPDWESKVSAGKFKFIRDFMAEKVYKHAAKYDSPQTMQHIVGREVAADTLLSYFDKKFS